MTLTHTTCFPLGVSGAAEVSMPVLCAATSASAFALQEGNADSIHSIYQHLGVKPGHYGTALRQMMVAWSASRWFAEPHEVFEAVQPTEAMIEDAIGRISKRSEQAHTAVFHDSFAAFFRNEIYTIAENQGMRAGIDCLEYAAYLSFRAGDIEASLTLLEDIWGLLPDVITAISASSHLKFAELWIRMGRMGRAREHIGLVGGNLLAVEDHLFVRSRVAKVYRESASFPQAALIAAALTQEKSVSRFLAHLGIAQEMAKKRKFGQAEAYIMNVCFPAANRTEDSHLRAIQLGKLLHELTKHKMDASMKRVMDALARATCSAQRI